MEEAGGSAAPPDEDIRRALLVLHRYSLELTEIAAAAFDRDVADNIPMQLLLAIHDRPGVSPSQLAQSTGRARSTVSRSLARLSAARLIRGRRMQQDQRWIALELSARGRRQVQRFAEALGDYFVQAEPMVKEGLHLTGVPAPDPHGPNEALAIADRMSRAGARYAAALADTIGPYSVTDRFALVLLREREVMRPSQLSEELHMSAAAVSGLLDRLEDDALIRRSYGESPADRRVALVRLTTRGEELTDAMTDVFRLHAGDLLEALTATLRTPQPSGRRPHAPDLRLER